LQMLSRRLLSTSALMDPLQKALMAEQCILVDEYDQPLGKASKEACHKLTSSNEQDLPLHRAFSLFAFDGRGRLLMQRRASAKVTFPGMWSNTCCSHPLADVAGEDHERKGVMMAAKRKVGQELGIPESEAQPADMHFLGKILYAAKSCDNWGEHELDSILFLKKCDEFSFSLELNENEVREVEYLEERHLQEFVRDKERDGSGVTPW